MHGRALYNEGGVSFSIQTKLFQIDSFHFLRVSCLRPYPGFRYFSGAIAGIVDQPMQNFQKTSEAQASAGHKAKGVISGVGKGIMGVFTKPIGGAAELVSQTGYGESWRTGQLGRHWLICVTIPRFPEDNLAPHMTKE